MPLFKKKAEMRIAAFGRSVHTQKPLKKIHQKLLCCASSVNLTV